MTGTLEGLLTTQASYGGSLCLRSQESILRARNPLPAPSTQRTLADKQLQQPLTPVHTSQLIETFLFIGSQIQAHRAEPCGSDELWVVPLFFGGSAPPTIPSCPLSGPQKPMDLLFLQPEREQIEGPGGGTHVLSFFNLSSTWFHQWSLLRAPHLKQPGVQG